MVRRNWIFVTIVLLLIAVIDSAYLVYHHHLVNIIHPDSVSFCSVNSVIDCDQAALSPYAMFAGIPVATLGLFAYLFLSIFILFGLSFRSDRLADYCAVLFLAALLMLLFVFYEAFMLIAVLNKICMICSILYICGIGLVFSIKKTLGSSPPEILKVANTTIISALSGFKRETILGPGLLALMISLLLSLTYDYQIQKNFIHQKAQLEPPLRDGLQIGLDFLNQNKTIPDVISLPSGLQYQIITKGTGAQPKSDNLVIVHYTGSLIDGSEFNNSRKSGKPVTLSLQSVIPGWQEGIGMMRVGGKRNLFIPSTLAYGSQSLGNLIPPNSVLIFEVELLGISN